MKIKIPPYPNKEITEKAFQRDVVSKSIEKNDSNGLSNHLVMILEFKTGERKVVNVRPVKYKNNLYITTFPNPIHLFLSIAIENYNQSENYKEKNFPKCGISVGDNVYMLEIEANGTHDCYNHYVKYRMSSIVMLVSAIEAFMNHIIPNDHIYETIRKNKNVQFDKVAIESPKITFKEKLIDIIPKCSTNGFLWSQYEQEKQMMLNLYENRKNLIHLKTNALDDFDKYFDAIDKMLDLDIWTTIDSVINVMNKLMPNFVEFETK